MPGSATPRGATVSYGRTKELAVGNAQRAVAVAPKGRPPAGRLRNSPTLWPRTHRGSPSRSASIVFSQALAAGQTTKAVGTSRKQRPIKGLHLHALATRRGELREQAVSTRRAHLRPPSAVVSLVARLECPDRPLNGLQDADRRLKSASNVMTSTTIIASQPCFRLPWLCQDGHNGTSGLDGPAATWSALGCLVWRWVT